MSSKWLLMCVLLCVLLWVIYYAFIYMRENNCYTQPDIFGDFSIINLPSMIQWLTYQHHVTIIGQLWKAGLLSKNQGKKTAV